MSEPFIGQIACFGFNFAPRGWAICQGQTLPISQNTALFSLLGVQFGGDGKSNFKLPDMQGQAPIGAGQGPGLDDYVVGQNGGSTTVTLLSQQLPAHNHGFACATSAGTTQAAAGNQQAKSQKGGGTAPVTSAVRFSTNAPTTAFAPTSIGPTGGNGPHNNMQPYLSLNFCIALQGVFPQRQ